MATEKVAITIDVQLLAQIERLRERTHESRSALFGRALRKLVLAEEHRQKAQRYVEAYIEKPENPEEIRAADRLARASLSLAPDWDER